MDKLDLILAELETIRVNMVTKDDISELQQITCALKDGQEEIKAQLDSLTITVAHMQGDISELKDGQLRQDKILESLALRSLEQETEIRDIKRIK